MLGLLSGRVLRVALPALALIGALAGIWWHGRLHERAIWRAERDVLVAARRAEAARIVGIAEQLVETEAARDALAATLEEAANADADAARDALPARSVRRIDRQ